MEKHFLLIALFLLFFLGMALIQFAAPDMPNNDGFYCNHVGFETKPGLIGPTDE